MTRPLPRQILTEAKMPAFLVSNLTNIRYLTGLSLSSGLLLTLPKKFVLFVDSRYADMALRQRVAEVKDVAEAAKILAAIPECGFESDDVTVSRKSVWKKKFSNTKFVQKNGIVEEFRRVKEETELKYLRKARKLTVELLRRVPSALRKSVTEEGLARQLQIWALELGADGLSFDPIVAFGNHTACPHHRPTSRLLKKGHLVQIDVGVKYRGYCGDMSEVYFTTAPTPLQQRLYGALREAKNKATKAVKAGVTTHALDKIAREILDREGVEDAFTHSLGHGVGLDVHEGPSLSQKAPAEKLLKNEVVTIEPGVYFPGKFGMRVEDMVFVE